MPSIPSVEPQSMFGSDRVHTDAEAEELGFTGSPTILVDGLGNLTRWWACPVGFTAPLKAPPAHRALSN
jgi:hypothetical protein